MFTSSDPTQPAHDFQEKSWVWFSQPPIFKENSTGGRWAQRVPIPGERVGESKVVRAVPFLFREHGQQVWEVQCPCGNIQLRTSGQINSALRRKGSLLCPECMGELRGGSFHERRVRSAERILERVLNGGPVWSDFETRQLQDAVLRDLEEEFGPLDHEGPITTGDMQVAIAGWPFDHSDSEYARTFRKEQAERAALRNKRIREERETQERIKVGQVAAALLHAAESGDQEALQEAITQDWKFQKKHRVRQPVFKPSEFVQQYISVTARCKRCGQRVLRNPETDTDADTIACSDECAARLKPKKKAVGGPVEAAKAQEVAKSYNAMRERLKGMMWMPAYAELIDSAIKRAHEVVERATQIAAYEAEKEAARVQEAVERAKKERERVDAILRDRKAAEEELRLARMRVEVGAVNATNVVVYVGRGGGFRRLSFEYTYKHDDNTTRRATFRTTDRAQADHMLRLMDAAKRIQRITER